ncbi:MAG: efflux RND transporter periplasmic adaptor subunit [Porticoccaceae bacterium]|nr:efflux RND transporter periplasmic adaptor subunit [Porticoccaceae bacterium]
MKKNLIIVGVLIALLAIAYFKQTVSSSAVLVTIENAKIEEIKSSILASGTLIYKEQIELRSEVIGQVSEMFLEEGDKVTKDQVLMRLDPRTFNADVEQQQAYVRLQTIAIERQTQELKNITSKWQRNKNLFERKMIGQDAYELIDNQYALARIDLRSRQESLTQAQATLDKSMERLEKTVFRSPIDGIATSVDIKVGETAISGTTNIAGSNLITVADPSSILVEVLVDEADIANVQIGQTADIFAVAYPDQALAGTVQNIATSAKRSSYRQGLSFTVKILLDTAGDIDIRPGMSCRAEIFTEIKNDTIAVPLEAVVFEDLDEMDDQNDTEQEPGTIMISASNEPDTSSYLYILVDGKAVKKPVELGISNDSVQEVISGLSLEDQVIIGPARVLSKLSDGDSVKEIEKKAD